MDTRKPDEMRSVGVVGVCKEAYNILHLHLRLFLSMGVTLVLPLGLVVFCHGLVVDPVLYKIYRDERDYAEAVNAGAPAAAQGPSGLGAEGWSMILNLTVFVFVLVYPLVPMAAIACTVASVYTSAKGLSYMKVLSAVPKVWKRLFITFLWAQLLIFITNFVLYFVFLFCFFFVEGLGNGNSSWVYIGVLLFPMFFGFCFLSGYVYVVWHLASVVSVLENSYGIAALRKSWELIKGRRWVACSVFLIYASFTGLALVTFDYLVYPSDHMSLPILGRFIIGLLVVLLWTAFTLIGLVVQTRVYFVCKSFHEESIDPFALSDHFDVRLGEYMPVKEPVSLEAHVET